MAKVIIKSEFCSGCKYCIKACPHNLLYLSDDFNSKGNNYVKYKGEGCTGCGFCFYSCPEIDAIEVYKEK